MTHYQQARPLLSWSDFLLSLQKSFSFWKDAHPLVRSWITALNSAGITTVRNFFLPWRHSFTARFWVKRSSVVSNQIISADETGMDQQHSHSVLGFVSAAYAQVRPDRAMEYYHRPLTDFLRAYRASGGRAVLTVHANRPSWAGAAELACLVDEVIEDEPEEHIGEVWPDPHWQHTYQQLICRNPTHANSYQARFPRLIAVYLAKVRIVELAFERGGYEVVLWHDAGHWVSHGSRHDIGQYSAGDGPEQTRGELLDQLLLKLTAAHPVVGTLSRSGRERFHMPLSWMREHAAMIDRTRADALVNSLYTAVLWAFRREAFAAFATAFRQAWDALIRRGQAGIEENAMTIAAWRQDVPGLAYPAWRRLLAGDLCCSDIIRPGE